MHGNYQYHDYQVKLQEIIQMYQIDNKKEDKENWRQDFNSQFSIQRIQINAIHLVAA